MNKKAHSNLYNSFLNAKRAVHLYLDIEVDDGFFSECIRVLQRGVAMEIFFSETQIKVIESAPFTLNKIFDLRSKGASIYSIDPHSINSAKCICQIDFKKTWQLAEGDDFRALQDGIYEDQLRELSSENPEYRKADGDISVTFTSDDTVVFEGKKTGIHWDTSNADSVTVSGLGQVKNSGSKNIHISKDTILVLKAVNLKGVKYKAIHLKAVEGVNIIYDLQFLNPASKEFVSLKSEDNYEGVFGVAKGYKVRLTWDVSNAENVLIKPFNLKRSKGEHVFTPAGTSEILIQAHLQNKVISKRIILHEFPMPLFTEKLATIKTNFKSTARVDLQDFRHKAYDFIDSKGLSDTWKNTDELRAKVKSQEEELLSLYNKLKFEDFYANHSVEKLNRSIIDRLKAYFSDRPEVLEMIKTLNQYDHER